MLIGLNIQSCIKDIVEGKVRRRDVAYIISHIDLTDGLNKSVGNGLSDLIDTYQRLYWYANKEQCKDLFFELYNEGVILCPKMVAINSNISFPSLASGDWLECNQVWEPEEQERIEWVSF